MNRSTAREAALCLIYEREMGGDGGQESIDAILACIYERLLTKDSQQPKLIPDEDDMLYISSCVNGVYDHLNDIDHNIEKFAVGWAISRMAKLDLSIMRLATYEMMYRDDIPSAASINEAIELSHTYSTDEAGSFINGVLGNMLRNMNV